MFEHLFTPITINTMTLPNRIVMPAMHLNYTMGGEMSDQLIQFYKERAEGGAGLMIIGKLKPIVKSASDLAWFAPLCLAFLAVGNAAGRVAWGVGFDRIGFRAVPLSLAGLAVGLGLFSVARTPGLFMTAAVLLGFGFGANFVVYASALSAHFGLEAFPRLYPFCFLGYGVAGLAGPPLGGWMAERTGSYGPALLLGLAILLAAAIATTIGLRTFRPAE